MTVRVAKEDFSLQVGSSSYNVRKDDIIALYPQLLHFDPEIYSDPLVSNDSQNSTSAEVDLHLVALLVSTVV